MPPPGTAPLPPAAMGGRHLPTEVSSRLAQIEMEYQQGELTQRGYEIRRSRLLTAVDIANLNLGGDRPTTSGVPSNPPLPLCFDLSLGCCCVDFKDASFDDISSPVSSIRPASGHSDTPSIDGNYKFSPPLNDAEHIDNRPRLEPLDLAFHTDGLSRDKLFLLIRHSNAIP
jgi:DMAP1-binding Domain